VSRFEIVRDPVLREEVWLAQSRAGLRVRVAPTARFAESIAVVTFAYGSVDLGFRTGSGPVRSPLGTAHYLEHKLFEDEELAAFERFARRGAQVNAMTSFARTSYYFHATSRFAENLQDLLHLVARVHVTPANVDKERGIIAQELRMYEDNPDYRAFFDLLQGLYAHHPVRHPVGGTVASIQAVTAEHLRECHAAFYGAGNAALAAAGPVDPEEVLALADASALAPRPEPQRLLDDDLGAPPRPAASLALPVARPRVLLGWKARALPGDAEARLREELVTRVLLDRLLGASSERRERLRRDGRIDDSLSVTHLADRTFGFTVVGCETEDPPATRAALLAALREPLRLDEGDLEPVRRKQLGSYLRTFEQVKGLGFGHASEALDGVAPFQTLARMRSIAPADVAARQRELFDETAHAWLEVAQA
jgi:predicted Zn-dependent peptidase